nr:zinc ribbon domain-containing protein [Maliibacterium massiliense]
MQETRYCQSCGMPLTDDLLGTQKDGSTQQDYCVYCYKDGAFTSDVDMEGMIAQCVPFMLEAHPGMDAAEADGMMRQFFPTLKRWR